MTNNKKLYQHTLVRLYSFLMACQPLHPDPTRPVAACRKLLHNNNNNNNNNNTLAPSALACHFI
ncbi:TPA: hypothetical protein ACU9NH_002687 [Citrobacter freundii]